MTKHLQRPIPVVPSADPDAPFGRDENDHPIKPLTLGHIVDGRVGGLAEAPINPPDSLERLGTTERPEFVPRIPTPKPPDRPEPTEFRPEPARELIHPEPEPVFNHGTHKYKITVDGETTFLTGRELYGVLKREQEEAKRVFLIHRREILGLSREDILRVLDVTIRTNCSTVEKKVPRTPREWLIQRIALASQMIERHESKIVQLSARMQRRTRTPENQLDRNARVRYQNHYRKRIRWLIIKRQEYRQRLRNFDTDDRNMKSLICVVDKPMKLTDFYNFDFKDTKHAVRYDPDRDEVFNELQEESGTYSVDLYREIFSAGEPDASYWSTADTSLDGSTKFENNIIGDAVRWRVIQPTVDQRKKLKLPVYSFSPAAEQPDNDDPHTEHSAEETQSINKTGGATIGGGVFGRGWRRVGNRLVPRGTDSFDDTQAHSEGKSGEADAPGFELGIDSGDWDPNEE